MYKRKEFAKLINVTPQTLKNWERLGKFIPITLPSGQKRYTEEHLEQILKGEK